MKRFLLTLCIVILAVIGCERSTDWQPTLFTQCNPAVFDSDFGGPYRAIIGYAEAAPAALRLAAERPDLFNAAAALGGPVDFDALMWRIDKWLTTDNFSDQNKPPYMAARIDFLTDLFKAYSNPLYQEGDGYYPPGVTASDFSPFKTKHIKGFVDWRNPDGQYDAITFQDSSGKAVPWALAVDLNGNGLRDPDEPLIVQMHERIKDDPSCINRYTDPDCFYDYGLDGVPGTGDYGEGNGIFDFNPRLNKLRAENPVPMLAAYPADIATSYRGAFYFDAGQEDEWGYAQDTQNAAEALKTSIANAGGVAGITSEHCVDPAGILRLYDFPYQSAYPIQYFFFKAKHTFLTFPPVLPGTPNHKGDANQEAARWTHALMFIAARMPNQPLGKDRRDYSMRGKWIEDSFESQYLGRRVWCRILLPPGYFTDHNRWHMYPTVYVLHGQGFTPDSMEEIRIYQTYLLGRFFGQEFIIVVVDGNRPDDLGGGFSFYTDQAVSGFGGPFEQSLVNELIPWIDSKYRAHNPRTRIR